MQKILNFLFSSRLMAMLFVVFFIAIGAATFVEEAYDTVTAKILIYDALWLELIMLFMAVNFIGNIAKYNLLRKEKIGTLLFHLAFVVIIVGAGITRYTGNEGLMPVREGETNNVMYSSEPYLQVSISNLKERYTYDKLLYLSNAPLVDNNFELPIQFKNNPPIKISYNNFFKNAIEKIEETPDGIPSLELVALAGGKPDTILVQLGEEKDLNGIGFAFENYKNGDGIVVTRSDTGYLIKSPQPIRRLSMATQVWDTIPADKMVKFKRKHLHNVENTAFVFFKEKTAIKSIISGKEDEEGIDALLVDVTDDKGDKQTLTLFGGLSATPAFSEFVKNDLLYTIGYGSKAIKLPFSIRCNDFIMDRYPGSNSPSSYESKVTLIDDKNNIAFDQKIYMNNVMDYDGYRFFQSSYDPDEKGTRLSVNQDFWGTWVTYIGYGLLTLGFIIAIAFNGSRFREVCTNIGKFHKKRSALTITAIAFLTIVPNLLKAEDIYTHVSEAHAQKLGEVLVLSKDGRFQPINTLAFDFAHKVARSETFELSNGSSIGPMRLFADMIATPQYWKNQKIIYLKKNTGVQKFIDLENTEKTASFQDFFGDHNRYKLAEAASKAWQKDKGKQNVLDKELMKTDERVNLMFMMFGGDLLKIFPEPGNPSNWINWTDSLARVPLSKTDEGAITYARLMGQYIYNLIKAKKSGDYSSADQVLNDILTIQRAVTPEASLPSKTMINNEISYNSSNPFSKLRNYYGLFALILLILATIEVIRVDSKILPKIVWALTAVVGILFLYHTYSMAIRWYITGHAPWSNGYEALVTIAWGGMLAGFIFVRYSRITVAATSLLAFFILMTAGHSQYDPQLTNLVPVLKSYWLNIHVLVITVSYGFFGLGFILALMTMIISLFRKTSNYQRLTLLIKEFTSINELTLIFGIALAAVGTFLGGVWANESWGRYWGWDQKETWALAIVACYGFVLHFRMIPGLRGPIAFNIGSLWGFGSVIMTFVGVNYYLSKGLHSYAAGDTPAFPDWVWSILALLLILSIASGIVDKKLKKQQNG